MTNPLKPHRVSVKFFSDPDPGAALELHPYIGMFHAFIQDGALPGLLIDVADYAHVPDGPGVMLIGHDVDYAIDRSGGRTGLLTVRKRCGDRLLADSLRDALRMALTAMYAIHQSVDTTVRFSTESFEIQVVDRLVAGNDDESFAAAKGEVESMLQEIFGDAKVDVVRANAGDSRKPLSLRVKAPVAPDSKALVERLGGAVNLSGPKQTHWDISVEDLKKLRDDSADFVLIDVREPVEFETCNLGGDLIPLGQIADKLGELDKGAHFAVHCKTGGRSAKAVESMRAAGFLNVWNVHGGILAWIDRIDPSLTRY